jgi:hypothetical protein
MTHIVLTEDQASVLASPVAAEDGVEVRDVKGRVLAFLKPLSPDLVEAILVCKRRLASPGPHVPSEDVQSHLRKLEEIRAREGMDREKMLGLLRRMRAGEEV